MKQIDRIFIENEVYQKYEIETVVSSSTAASNEIFEMIDITIKDESHQICYMMSMVTLNEWYMIVSNKQTKLLYWKYDSLT